MRPVRVKDVMKPSTVQVRTCDENTCIEEAVGLMREYNVCRLVVTRNDRAIGVVTLKSLLQSPVDRQTRDNVLHALIWPNRFVS